MKLRCAAVSLVATLATWATPGAWAQAGGAWAQAGGASANTGGARAVVPAVSVQACTACHGREGRAAADGFYPRIAGKPADYLLHQLQAFRDGRRQYALMTHLLEPLDDRYLREIAQHFAQLQLPYPPPRPAEASAEVLARGQALVQRGDPARRLPACTACHGTAMTGVAPAVPGLLGLPRDYLNAQLGAWRTGQRRALAPDCMAQVAQALAPEDIGAVAAWLAAQPVPAGGHPAETAPGPWPARCGGVAP
ncbi:MAG: c-type cytochrome [Rubrivivax sp.]